jgi:predicted component of type VI protein secretion system
MRPSTLLLPAAFADKLSSTASTPAAAAIALPPPPRRRQTAADIALSRCRHRAAASHFAPPPSCQLGLGIHRHRRRYYHRQRQSLAIGAIVDDNCDKIF